MSEHLLDLQRRSLLQAMAGVTTVGAAPALWAAPRTARAPAGRLVVVFLRGAYDGLSALVPYGDPDYYRLRPNIAVAAPDGTAQATLLLDSTFGLHPALAPLMPFWQQGVLSVIPAAGSPDPTRSHFDAQHHWETGIPGKSSSATGWLNGLAGLRTQGQGSSAPVAVAVGEANPAILSGSTPVQRVPRGDAATKEGSLGDARTRSALMRLYAGEDEISRTFQSGAESRMLTAKTLTEGMADASLESPQMQAASNGAGPAKGLLLDAQHLGTLMRKNPHLRIGFLSAGGWDTHANQGNQTGSLANNLGSLAAALVQLRKDFSGPDDTLVVMSEFGRTSAENGTRGTDHGHGNALWLMGNRVQGGRWHGAWSGLAQANLHEGRDLPVHHDFRGIWAQVLRSTQGLTATQIDSLFPGFSWDAGLNGLMHA